jgi:hypothetical protein
LPRGFVAERLRTSELVFLLMPFRHGVERAFDPRAEPTAAALIAAVETVADRRAQLRAVLAGLAQRDAALAAEAALVARFRKQTLRALAAADDLAKAPPAAVAVEVAGSDAANTAERTAAGSSSSSSSNPSSNPSTSMAALSVEFGDLLERLPAACGDEALLSKGDDPLLQTVDKFLTRHLKSGGSGSRRCGSNGARPVLALSLSGGVDSMVLLRLLASPWLRKRHNHYRVLCLHVNYGNRREAGREARFVEAWVRDHGGGAPRRGNDEDAEAAEAAEAAEDEAAGTVVAKAGGKEGQEDSPRASFLCCETLVVGGGRNDGTTKREDFEADSRKLRFDFYKRQLALHGGSCEPLAGLGAAGAPPCTGVLLAHHLGDVEENVLSNAMRGAPPDALSGMREVRNSCRRFRAFP